VLLTSLDQSNLDAAFLPSEWNNNNKPSHLCSKPGCDAWIENLRWKGNDHVKYVFETHPSEDNDRTSLTAYFQITGKDGQVVKRPRQWTKDFVDCEPDWDDHVQFGALIRPRLL
jgi:hypothetical protein